jgi:hypothetical protein
MNASVQAFGVSVVVVFLTVIIRMVRGRKLRAKYSFLWLAVGAVVLVISLVPGLLDRMSSFVGIYYPPAFLFVSAAMLLLFVAVHFSWELSRLEDRTRTLAEEVALLNEIVDHRRDNPSLAENPISVFRNDVG